ncbi:MAG: hypothetical protein IGR93_09370, partial [Hydrococcus sp. C42_A2020_068]|nr:hypothetical protein [Hydrococcus sp. C42_A2020_068]
GEASETSDVAQAKSVGSSCNGRWTANIAGQVDEFFPYAALFAWQPPETDTFPGSSGGPRAIDTYPRYILSVISDRQSAEE